MKKIIILLCTIAILLAIFNISLTIYEYKTSSNYYESFDEITFIENEITTSVEDKDNKDFANINIKVDFDMLKKVNSDIVGWIYIEDTPINYPIVQGKDNSFYLKHLFNKEYGIAGCVFLDCNNSSDFKDLNSVVYGHHMRDETMFTSIAKYKKQSYYDEHQIAIIITPHETITVKLFAGFVANPQSDDAWKIEFKEKYEFELWKEKIIAKSLFKSNYIPNKDDTIITFSTCSYEFDDARFVLYGAVSK